MPVRQTLVGRYAPGGTVTEYVSVGMLRHPGTTEVNVSHRWLAGATATGLKVRLSAAPGTGASRTWTLRVNGISTLLTVTLSGGDTEQSIESAVALTDGDLVSLEQIPSGGPTAAVATISLVIDGAESAISCYGGSNGGTTISSAEAVDGVFSGDGWANVGDRLVRNLMPTSGTITRMVVDLDVPPGPGESIAFEVYVNENAQLIGLSLSDDQIYGAATCSIALAPLDRVYVKATRSAGCAEVTARPAYRFEATVDGESVVCSPGGADVIGPDATEYSPPRQFDLDGTEDPVLGGIAPFTVRNMVGALHNSAGGTMDEVTIRLRVNSADTAQVVVIPATLLGEYNDELGVGADVTVNPDDLWNISVTSGGGLFAWVFWGMAQFDLAQVPQGTPGPLVWVEWPRRQPDGTTARNYYSDHDMQCHASYYGGFKEARVMRFGDGERALSHRSTGDWTGATFTLDISDYDRSIRERLNSPTDRYWSLPLAVRIVDRPTRAALGVPYTVFVGPIIEARPTAPMGWSLTLGDIVSQLLLSDEAQVPWRLIRDGFLSQLVAISEDLDAEAPEPIIYGKNIRTPIDVPSGQGLCVTPIYLGIENLGADDWHVWLLAGHACADIPDIKVDHASVIADEGTQWLVPHHAGWTAMFTTPYVDRRSDTFGNDRRYTLIYGKVSDPGFLDPEVEIDEENLTDPDACALRRKGLTVAVWGVEPEGDGTGEVINDRLAQYRHFLINFVANAGQRSYQSGDWLEIPTWSIHGATVPVIDSASFDTCSAIGVVRLGVDGYVGAGVVGAKAGERGSARRWIAEWNRSCSTQIGISNMGQLRVVMLHPTEAIKSAAPLFDDVNDILRGSFHTEVLWSEHANRIPFRTDLEYSSAKWLTNEVQTDGESVSAYNREIIGEARDYRFAPGITQANNLALIDLRVHRHPPRLVRFETALGDLVTMDLGDYIRYRHFASVGEASSEIRLAQIQRHQVLAGKRRVLVEALDCEDLIDYDLPEEPEAASSPTCADAIIIDPTPDTSYTATIDSTAAPTDTSVAGLLPDGGVAYHAVWHEITPANDGRLFVTTVHSQYDTHLAIFTGACGALALEAYNDNDGLLNTSVLDIPVVGGTTYRILAAGFGPDDGGQLTIGVLHTEN